MQSTQAQPVMSALRTATKVWLAALCFGVPCVGAQTPSSPPTPMQVVRREIVAGTLRGALHGDVARYRLALLRIYADSTSRALWLSGATLTRQAERVLTELGEAENRGLRASGYDAEALSRALTIARAGAGELPDSVERLRADAWLTFRRCASWIMCIAAGSIHARWALRCPNHTGSTTSFPLSSPCARLRTFTRCSIHSSHRSRASER